DDVALARDEVEPPVRVAAHEVARPEPAVDERRPRLLRVAEVALHDDRRLHEELADGVRRNVPSLLVHHAALRPGARRVGMLPDEAHAARPARALEGRAEDARNLRHAEPAHEMRDAELVAK